MKKKFFVLSALLILAMNIICLQSCSSDSDRYSTEEYGTYTDDEILVINNLAEIYGIGVSIDRNYYGIKKTIKEFEADFQSLSKLAGEYRMTNGTIAYKSESNGPASTVPKTAESQKGEGSVSQTAGEYKVSVSLSWQTSVNALPGTATGSFSVAKGEEGTDGTSGNLNCSMGGAGTITITFSGSKSWTVGGVTYTCSISQGTYDIEKNIGSFVVSVVNNQKPDEPSLW